jgi:DNA repair protein RadC
VEQTIPRYELRKLQSDFPAVTISSSEDACDFIKQFYSDDMDIFESSFVLLLNRANTTIGYAKISQGGLTGTVVDPRLVAKYAVESLATSIILAHNHPSGNLKPSTQDIDLTRRVKEGLKLLDIEVFDHIILTSAGHYSLLENGLM